MRVKLAALMLLLGPGLVQAAGGLSPMPVKTDLGDTASLQRGARMYVNYCLGCHSLAYLRYNRLAEDLEIPPDLLAANLQFTGDKVVDPMTIAMSGEQARAWFGVAPPDLSVTARARGPDWLYSYLTTFYRDDDPARPFGVNNLVFPGAAMPHVLLELQGRQEYRAAELPVGAKESHPARIEAVGDVIRVHREVLLDGGVHTRVVDTLEVVEAGMMRPGEYRKAVRDLVNFLVYAGEPAKLVRYRMGVWVVLFLVAFFFLTRLLYKEYWKDVH